MTKSIDTLLCESIERSCPDKEVAVMFSGGVDSHSIAFAAKRLGKTISTYSFCLEGIPTYDSEKARETSSIFGWKHLQIEVPTNNLEQDFLDLYSKYGARKKTQFECLWPFIYVFPQVQETHILSGLHADKFYGMTKSEGIHIVKDDKKFFDYRKDLYYTGIREGTFQSVLHQSMAKQFGKEFHAIYLQDEICEFFLQYNWKELHRPKQKNHVREAFADEFKLVGEVKKHWDFQICAKIPDLFEQKLLNNPTINFKSRGRFMDVYRDWTRKDSTPTTKVEDLFV